MKKIILAFVALFLVLISASSAKADGGFFPPPDYYVFGKTQKAIIVYDGNTETLIISTSFIEDAKKFGWVIPTPSQPEVDKSTADVFVALQNLTSVKPTGRIVPMMTSGLGGAEEKAVEVLEEKTVDIYDIAVLSATDENSLYDWLNQNGYSYPKSGKTILDDYIQKGWFFTAVKVNAEKISAQTTASLKEGTAIPLKLVFETDKMVYPMKISSVMPELEKSKVTEFNDPLNTPVEINLYIFASHRKDIASFKTEWANWIKRTDIEKLATDDNGNPWFSPTQGKLFLTALQRSMKPSEMTSDFYPVDAKNNNKVKDGQETSASNWILAFILTVFIAMVSPLGIMFIVASLVHGLAKTRVWRIVALVFQGVAILFTKLVGIAIGLLLVDYSEVSAYIWGMILVLVAMAAVLVILIVRDVKKGLLK